MPLVKFLGKSTTYVVGRYKFSRENEGVVEVAAGDVKALVGMSDRKGNRLFAAVQDEPLGDDVIAAKRAETVLASHRVGKFNSKEDAVAYARTLHAVELDPNNNLKALNEQTVELFKRAERGVVGPALVEGINRAILIETPADGDKPKGKVIITKKKAEADKPVTPAASDAADKVTAPAEQQKTEADTAVVSEPPKNPSDLVEV